MCSTSALTTDSTSQYSTHLQKLDTSTENTSSKIERILPKILLSLAITALLAAAVFGVMGLLHVYHINVIPSNFLTPLFDKLGTTGMWIEMGSMILFSGALGLLIHQHREKHVPIEDEKSNEDKEKSASHKSFSQKSIEKSEHESVQDSPPEDTPHKSSRDRMQKNLKKALIEHRKDVTAKQQDENYFGIVEEKSVDNIYVSEAYLEEIQWNRNSTSPFVFNHTVDALQSGRKKMEDAHFYNAFPKGTLVGVLDGHGGNQAANYLSQHFEDVFTQFLDKHPNDVLQAFTCTFNQLQENLKQEISKSGSTAVISFIDKNNIIYTATLGDSEATLYRPVENQLRSIPLSCVRDWSSIKDAQRAAELFQDPSIATDWPNRSNPKLLRCFGLNVSRSFGDFRSNGSVIQKPKITMFPLEKDDILILSCDGLKDFVCESDILSIINTYQTQTGEQDLAKALVEKSILNQNYTNRFDNVTVIAIDVKEQINK